MAQVWRAFLGIADAIVVHVVARILRTRVHVGAQAVGVQVIVVVVEAGVTDVTGMVSVNVRLIAVGIRCTVVYRVVNTIDIRIPSDNILGGRIVGEIIPNRRCAAAPTQTTTRLPRGV